MADQPMAIFLALWLALAVVPMAAAGEGEKPPPSTGATTKSAEKDSAPGKDSPPPARVGRSAAQRGVTVLIEGWKSPIRARSYPEGVTILGRVPRHPGRAPVIRLTVPSAEETIPDVVINTPELPPATTYEELDPPGDDLLDDPATIIRDRRRKGRGRDPLGPSVSEQLEVFGRDPQMAGRLLKDSSTWQPNSSFEKGDPAHPYRWNPARFSEPSIDPEWKPTDAWPGRSEATPYPWNPATFSEGAFDPTWTPTDAWGRSVEVPAALERYRLSPPPKGAPLPAATSGKGAAQTDAPSAQSSGKQPTSSADQGAGGGSGSGKSDSGKR